MRHILHHQHPAPGGIAPAKRRLGSRSALQYRYAMISPLQYLRENVLPTLDVNAKNMAEDIEKALNRLGAVSEDIWKIDPAMLPDRNT